MKSYEGSYEVTPDDIIKMTPGFLITLRWHALIQMGKIIMISLVVTCCKVAEF